MWRASRPGHFTPSEKPPVPVAKEASGGGAIGGGGAQSVCEDLKKRRNSILVGNRKISGLSRPQPSHYTDWSIPEIKIAQNKNHKRLSQVQIWNLIETSWVIRNHVLLSASAKGRVQPRKLVFQN
jgi:hypothetical protein